MEFNKQTIHKIIGIIAFAILFYWGLQNFNLVFKVVQFFFGLAMPFLIGGFIAFLVNVPLRAVERTIFDTPKNSPSQKIIPQTKSSQKMLDFKTNKKPKSGFRRTISLIVTLMLVVGVLLIVIFLIVPEIINSFRMLKNSIPSFLSKIQAWTSTIANQVPELAAWVTALNLDWTQLGKLNWGQLGGKIFEFLSSGAGSFFNSTFNIAASIFSGIVTGFLAIIFAFYILMNKEKLCRQSKLILYAYFPESFSDKIIEIAALTDRTFSRFLSGQCIEAVILGTLFFIAMSILRFPYALMISALIGFTALIPIFGAFIGCAVGAFLILMVNPMQAVWFVALFLILQQIEGNFIYPKVVGNSVGLPSMWVLVAVTVGASTMGILGMLVYIPMFSVFYSLIRGSVRANIKGKSVDPKKLG